MQDHLLRQFLLTNLVEQDGRFRWRVNLKGIMTNLHHIIGEFPFNSTYSGPTLFIGGQESDYIKYANYYQVIIGKYCSVDSLIADPVITDKSVRYFQPPNSTTYQERDTGCTLKNRTSF